MFYFTKWLPGFCLGQMEHRAKRICEKSKFDNFVENKSCVILPNDEVDTQNFGFENKQLSSSE